MMTIARFVPVAAVFVAAPAFSQDQVERGPRPEWVVTTEPLAVPDDADGLVFVRQQDTLIHLSDDGQQTYSGQMVRILHPQALEAGNVGLIWNPAAGAPTVHALRIHRAGEIIDVLDTTEFEIVRQEEQLEQAVLQGLLTAQLRVPDLRVGDDLEMSFTIPSHDPTLGEESFGWFAFGDQPPAGRFKLGLSWEDGQEPKVLISDYFGDNYSREDNSISFPLENPAIVNPPNQAPPRYSWTRIVQFTDFNDWQSISRRFEAMYETASTLPENSSVKKEAAAIARAHPSDLARAQAALELVQRQVRYIFVGLNGGNLTPATADETWERRYGDCKGKTALLLALLDELGIESEAVLANNSGFDDGMDERLPSPGLFDHVLVRATIDGEKYWLDGTLPDVATVRTDPVLPYRFVLPLSKSGTALEPLPFTRASYPNEMGLFEIDAREGFDVPARQKQVTVSRGLPGLLEYSQFSAIPSAQLENILRNQLTGSAWETVENVDYRFDRETLASILTIEGTARVDWDVGDDGSYSLTLPRGGFSPPIRRQRASDQDQDAPYYTAPSFICHTTTVRLPDETDLDHWSFNTVFDTLMFGSLYYRMMEKRDDGTIRMVRAMRVEQPEISANRAARDNRRIERFDNSMARIMYDPDQEMPARGATRSVPAIDEIDWTAPDAPCLPQDVTEETD